MRCSRLSLFSPSLVLLSTLSISSFSFTLFHPTRRWSSSHHLDSRLFLPYTYPSQFTKKARTYNEGRHWSRSHGPYRSRLCSSPADWNARQCSRQLLGHGIRLRPCWSILAPLGRLRDKVLAPDSPRDGSRHARHCTVELSANIVVFFPRFCTSWHR